MNKEKDSKFLYHGTVKWYADDIVNRGIDLLKNRENTDFGKGFYVTTKRSQAWDWAIKRNAAFPAVVKFKNQLDGLKILNLNSKKLLPDWKHVVYSNRVLRSIDSNWVDPCAGYDCIIGPMADGATYDVSQQAIENKWPEEEFFKRLKKIIDGSQIAIKTQAGIRALGNGKLDRR